MSKKGWTSARFTDVVFANTARKHCHPTLSHRCGQSHKEKLEEDYAQTFNANKQVMEKEAKVAMEKQAKVAMFGIKKLRDEEEITDLVEEFIVEYVTEGHIANVDGFNNQEEYDAYYITVQESFAKMYHEFLSMEEDKEEETAIRVRVVRRAVIRGLGVLEEREGKVAYNRVEQLKELDSKMLAALKPMLEFLVKIVEEEHKKKFTSSWFTMSAKGGNPTADAQAVPVHVLPQGPSEGLAPSMPAGANVAAAPHAADIETAGARSEEARNRE